VNRLIIGSSLVLALVFFSNRRSFAQTAPHEVVINAGIGLSGIAPDLFVFGYPLPDETEFTAITNEFGGTVDYGLLKWLSVGIGIGYQEVKEEYLGTGAGDYAIFSRTNYGLRILAHLNRTHKNVFDTYVGIRPGISIWKDVKLWTPFYNPTPFYPNLVFPFNSYFSFQLVYGLRYYFTSFLGLHAEVGIGPPYALEGGITIRIGYHKPAEESATSK
jgi:hypothetical protein